MSAYLHERWQHQHTHFSQKLVVHLDVHVFVQHLYMAVVADVLSFRNLNLFITIPTFPFCVWMVSKSMFDMSAALKDTGGRYGA